MNQLEPPFIGLVRQYMQQPDPLERIRMMAEIQRITSVVLADEVTMARQGKISWSSMCQTLDMPRATLTRQHRAGQVVVPLRMPVPSPPADEPQRSESF